MTPEERQAALDRLRAYADMIEAADGEAQKSSLDRARDMLVIYEDRSWVNEIEPPKRKEDPADSQARFATWSRDVADIHLTGRWMQKLLKAGRFVSGASTGRTAQLENEWALRPFYRLAQKGLDDRENEAIARAAALAEDGPITSVHARQAVSEIIASIPKPEMNKRLGRKRCEVNANKTIMYFERILDDPDDESFEIAKEALATMIELAKAHKPRKPRKLEVVA